MTKFVPILIYLVIPILGLLLYQQVCTVMDRRKVREAPRVVLAILFATYGGWLLVLLTSWLWYWSGLASLGLLYLVVVAPVLSVGFGLYLYPKRKASAFHSAAFLASAGYAIVPIAVVILTR